MNVERSKSRTNARNLVFKALRKMRHEFTPENVSREAGIDPKIVLDEMFRIKREFDTTRNPSLTVVRMSSDSSVWKLGSAYPMKMNDVFEEVRASARDMQGTWTVAELCEKCGLPSQVVGNCVHKMLRIGDVEKAGSIDRTRNIYRTTNSEPKQSVTLPDPVAPPLHRFNDLTGAERQAIEHATACWVNLMQSAKDLLEEARRLADKAQPFLDEAAEWRSVVESLGGGIDPNYAD